MTLRVVKLLYPFIYWILLNPFMYINWSLYILYITSSLTHSILLWWPRKGSLMKTQTRILDNRLYYTRNVELHMKGKKSLTIRITPILICGI